MRTTLRITGLISLLARISPGLGAAVNCTTYQGKTLRRLQTLCDDGTRATSYWTEPWSAGRPRSSRRRALGDRVPPRCTRR
jgi:hypothetical protein